MKILLTRYHRCYNISCKYTIITQKALIQTFVVSFVVNFGCLARNFVHHCTLGQSSPPNFLSVLRAFQFSFFFQYRLLFFTNSCTAVATFGSVTNSFVDMRSCSISFSSCSTKIFWAPKTYT